MVKVRPPGVSGVSGHLAELDRAVVRGHLVVEQHRQPADADADLGLPDVEHVGGRGRRQGRVDQPGGGLAGAEQEAAQVLVALFGIHLAVAAGMGAVHERPAGSPHVGVVDLHQPVALGAHRL